MWHRHIPNKNRQLTALHWWHQHGVSIQSSTNLGEMFRNNTGMTNRTDLNLGEVVYISVIYHISDSWLKLLMARDRWVIIFICEDVTAENSNTTVVTFTFCLSYPGGLETSAILGSLDHSTYLGKLMTYLDPVLPSILRSYFVRCWHARTDGSAASTFHTNCDGKGPTVTIIRAGQYIFGAYTDVSWRKYHKT